MGCGLSTHMSGWGTDWMASRVLGVPGAVGTGVPPALCLLLLASAPSSRSEVFRFPLSSIRTLALGAQREPRCFPAVQTVC